MMLFPFEQSMRLIFEEMCQRQVTVASESMSGHILALEVFPPNLLHFQGKHGRCREQIPRERTGQILRR
jgi:hypothetical protein